MFRILVALSLSIVTTSVFAQMSGRQFAYGSNIPTETEIKIVSYKRGHVNDNSKSGIDALKELGLSADSNKSKYADGEVIIQKLQNSNASDTTYRVALLIGNTEYPSDRVITPVNDVTELSNSLLNAGFEVTEIRNCPLNVMMKEIASFIERSKKAKYSVFYFGGHAINFDGDNYILPVGVELKGESQLANTTYSISSLLKSVKQTKMDLRTGREILVLLDASRYNHFYFPMNIKRQRSLAKIKAPAGVLVLSASSTGFNAKTDYKNTSLFGYIVSRELELKQPVFETCSYTQSEIVRLSNKMQKPVISGKMQTQLLIK